MTSREQLPYEHEFRWRRRILLVSITGLALLVGLGITTSSLSLNSASGSDSSAQVLWGEAQPTRSDEWLRSTPYWIGRWNDDWSPTLLTPLEYRSEQSVHSTVAEWIVYPERQIGLLLPTRIGFPLLWWAPVIGAFTAVSLLLLRITRSSSVAIGSSLLMVLSPVVAWWSFSPLEIIWPAASAVLLVDMARDSWSRIGRTGRQPIKAVLLAVASGIAASRLAFNYTPWAVITIIVFIGISADFIIRRHGWRDVLLPALAATTTAVVAAGYRLLILRNEYRTLADTIYPGQRRTAAGPSNVPLMSGALGGLNQRAENAASIVGTNLSEVARGWSVLLIPAALIVIVAGVAQIVRAKWLLRGTRAPVVPYTTMAMTAIVVSWSEVTWPSALRRFNPLTLVSPDRTAQMIGALAPLLVAVALPVSMSSLPIHVRRLMGIVVALLSSVVIIRAGADLTGWIPTLDASSRGVVALLAGLTAGGLVFAQRNQPVIAVAVVLALLSVAWVNPLTRGLGDLVLAPATAEVRGVVKAGEGRVASDNFFVDAMIAANALPQLSGLQTWGPNVDAWKKLDPDEEFVEHWNRGTSYLRFEWAATGENLSIRDQGDQIFVRVDPCDHRLSELDLGFVISMAPRNDACLTEKLRFTWSGLGNWMYARS